MTDLEKATQVLRDEIAWHEREIAFDTRTRQTGCAYRISEHRARIAALSAAVPAPGDAHPSPQTKAECDCPRSGECDAARCCLAESGTDAGN